MRSFRRSLHLSRVNRRIFVGQAGTLRRDAGALCSVRGGLLFARDTPVGLASLAPGLGHLTRRFITAARVCLATSG